MLSLYHLDFLETSFSFGDQFLGWSNSDVAPEPLLLVKDRCQPEFSPVAAPHGPASQTLHQNQSRVLHALVALPGRGSRTPASFIFHRLMFDKPQSYSYGARAHRRCQFTNPFRLADRCGPVGWASQINHKSTGEHDQ